MEYSTHSGIFGWDKYGQPLDCIGRPFIPTREQIVSYQIERAFQRIEELEKQLVEDE